MLALIASNQSQNHRIIKSFELKVTLKGHLLQLPCNEREFGQS